MCLKIFLALYILMSLVSVVGLPVCVLLPTAAYPQTDLICSLIGCYLSIWLAETSLIGQLSPASISGLVTSPHQQHQLQTNISGTKHTVSLLSLSLEWLMMVGSKTLCKWSVWCVWCGRGQVSNISLQQKTLLLVSWERMQTIERVRGKEKSNTPVTTW